MWRNTELVRGLTLSLALLLAACAGAPQRSADPQQAESPRPAATQAAPPELPKSSSESPGAEPALAETPMHADGLEPSADTAANGSSPPMDFWAGLRSELQFTRCADEDTQSRHWTKRYAGYPQRFQQTIEQIAPLMQYVAAELRAADLPVDFVFLPIVESTYFPHRSRGERPAGIWQLMPQTARGYGAPMKPQYDGRLDYAQATHAAITLLTHLRVQFNDDWKLVNMAFNAGEYRVKNALKGSKGSRLPEPRGLSPITIEHYAKLRSLGCLIDQPERFNLQLPIIDDTRALASVELPEAWPIEFLAHLLVIDPQELKKLNPGLFGTHTPGFPGYRLMVPARAKDDLIAGLAPLPTAVSARWQRVALADPEQQRTLVLQSGLEWDLFTSINRQGGERVWLPTGTGVPKPVALSEPAGETYRVRQGDTLWHIAKRYRLRVQQLVDWNGLGKRALIKPGQWLRLRAPE
ncbi:MAG: transglycosylase SLT domain-containing protein [Ahniella sp.]|nr:transglycosylase SLT domain-containing protein [Ahniella sp.]